jgi:hypothetical protein
LVERELVHAVPDAVNALLRSEPAFVFLLRKAASVFQSLQDPGHANSSRLLAVMARNFTRSSRGFDGSAASSSTRRLNCSQLSSRLMKRPSGGGVDAGLE